MMPVMWIPLSYEKDQQPFQAQLTGQTLQDRNLINLN